MKFDYIIAGGGTCGLLLANRLSADPSVTVVVIEPGQDVRDDPNVTIPANFLPESFFNSPIDWAYVTEPQAGGANRTLELHAGKALGRSSTINGMTYIRADKAEINAWETLGNGGWNWETLLPYYRGVERFSPPTAAQVAVGASYQAEFHGEHGLLHVGNLYALPNETFHEIVRDTWQSLGYSVNPDVNSGDTRGFGMYPMTVDREANLRWDAARAYYYPIENRTNLKILRGTARKLTWNAQHEDDGKAASGVEVVDANNNMITIGVGKEVIFVLEDLGIDTAIELPGVGENPQEQPNTSLVFTASLSVAEYAPYATFGTADDIFGPEKVALAEATRSNLTQYAQAIASASNTGLNSNVIEQVLRIQHDLVFAKNVNISETITLAAFGYLVTTHWLLLPFSRGSVHLGGRSNNPAIDPRYFLVGFDMTQQIGIGRQAQKFWNSAPMRQYITSNVSAVPATDEEWMKFIENSFSPNYHPVGTAAMMPRHLGGVVNEDLKVYGASNVRVVDASVLPLQVSGHPTSTLNAVAERASDMVRASFRNRHKVL